MLEYRVGLSFFTKFTENGRQSGHLWKFGFWSEPKNRKDVKVERGIRNKVEFQNKDEF